MSEEAALERGRRAKAVLADATVMEAFDYIAEKLTGEWRHTNGAQSQHREIIHAQLAGLDALKRQLAGWVDQAKSIEIERERKTQRKATALRLIGR